VNDQTDSQLLRAYAEHWSEPAFANWCGNIQNVHPAKAGWGDALKERFNHG
jgi:hypothetical protein